MSGKRRVRVTIPTSGGMSDIVALRREPAELGESVVCCDVDGYTRMAGIRLDYDAFVRASGGLIESRFGHGAFRMDVSRPIDVGASWQLAAFLAHGLEAVGELWQQTEPETPENVLVWATGTLRSVDLAVGEVGHVSDKARLSLAELRDAVARGVRCIMLLAPGNQPDIEPAVRAELEALGVHIETVANSGEAFALLDVPLPPGVRAGFESGAAWGVNPYPGLRPYDRGDRAVFFGRARAREEALTQLRVNAARGRAFLLVHGSSGTGKSSLVRAGMAGDIVHRVFEGGDWRVAVADFSMAAEPPLQTIWAAVADAFQLGAEARTDFLAACADDLAGAVRAQLALRRPTATGASLLLILDQVEQALLGLGDADALARFGKAIEALADSGCAWVVGTMRTDQMEMLEGSPELARLAADDRLYRLPPPSLFELTEIITQPALLAGFAFEAHAPRSLPGELTEVAFQSPDALPVLQLVLSRMVEAAGPDRLLTWEIYERIGGFDGAIVKCAQDALAALAALGVSDTEIDHALSELVRADQTGEHALARESVLLAGTDAASVRAQVLRHLVDARLLVSFSSQRGTAVRIAHEALVRHWPRLQTVIRRAGAALLARDKLDLAAREWHEGGRDEALLWRGEERIAVAETLLDNPVLALEAGTQAFIRASRQAHEQARLREQQAQEDRVRAAAEKERLARSVMRRTVAGAVAALLLAAVAVGAGWWSYRFYRLASASESLGLARLAVERAWEDPMSAQTLALAAYQADTRVDAPGRAIADEALAAVLEQPRLQALIAPEADISGFTVARSGAAVATGHGDGTFRLWDARTGRPLGSGRGQGPIVSLAFAEDGKQLVAASQWGWVERWDVSRADAPASLSRLFVGEREPAGQALDGDAPADDMPQINDQPWIISDIRLSGDGRRVVVAGAGMRTAWDVRTGARLARQTDVSMEQISDFVLSDDGSVLVDLDGQVWDIESNALRSVEFHADRIAQLALSENYLWVLSPFGDADRIDLRDLAIREAVPFGAGSGYERYPAAFHVDEQGGYMILYDEGALVVGASFKEGDYETHEVIESLDARWLSPGKAVLRTMVADLRIVQVPDKERARPVPGLPRDPRQRYLAVSQDGATAVAVGPDGAVALTDLLSGDVLATFSGSRDGLLDMPQFSQDGRCASILFAGPAQQAHLQRQCRAGAGGKAGTHALSPLSGYPATKWMLSDGGGYLVELGSEAPAPEGRAGAPASEVVVRAVTSPDAAVARYRLRVDEGEAEVIGVSPDGRTLAVVGAYAGVRLVDLASGAYQSLFPGTASRIRYTPDGAYFWMQEDNRLTVFDARTQLALGVLRLAPAMPGQDEGAASWRVLAAGQARFLLGTPGGEAGVQRIVEWRPEFLARSLRQRACASLPYVNGRRPASVAGVMGKFDLDALCSG